MVLMIIKGLFRRYEKWNPVHPTSGAFWGMGIGVGCGVGWGPGFGPEVIGYVGAGCGVGFSVGITFAGLGVGLPANHVFKLPFSALMATRSGALDLARSSGLLGKGDVTQDGWINAGVDVSGMQKRLSSFKPEQFLDKKLDLSAMNNLVSSRAKLVSDSFNKFKSCFVHPR